jgi:hypothetical protein
MKIDLGYDEPRPSEPVCSGCDEPQTDCVCETRCQRCHEPVYFTEGVSGPERWKHVATRSHACSPTCAKCKKPATNKVLRHGQFSHWECNDCAPKTFRIEHT